MSEVSLISSSSKSINGSYSPNLGLLIETCELK